MWREREKERERERERESSEVEARACAAGVRAVCGLAVYKESQHYLLRHLLWGQNLLSEVEPTKNNLSLPCKNGATEPFTKCRLPQVGSHGAPHELCNQQEQPQLRGQNGTNEASHGFASAAAITHGF